MRFTVPVVVVYTVLSLLTGCNGGAESTPQITAGTAEFTLRSVDAMGGELPVDSAGIIATAATKTEGAERSIELHAYDTRVAGLELEYDAAAWHVARVEQGDYFATDDLFLAVTHLPGRFVSGGYHSSESAPVGSLMARVVLSAGPPPRTTATLLPTTPGCTPLGFSLIDVGDGTAQLEWDYNCTGDYNQDGMVTVADITPIGIHYNKNYTDPEWGSARLADGIADNYITVNDLTPIGQNYERAVTGYQIEQGAGNAGPFSSVDTVPHSAGSPTPWLHFSYSLAAPADGAWYRVRTYHASAEGEGAATDALQMNLLPTGTNPVSIPAADVFSGSVPLTVNFSDGGSHDEDGTIVQWLWDLDNDMIFEIDATAQLGNASHTYTQPGSYFGRLKVIDNDGRSDYNSVIITAVGVSDPPEARATCMPHQGWGPLTVHFSPFGSTDPDGSITAWAWDFDGDGLYETDATAELGYADHTFTVPGIHTVGLQVTDDTTVTATAVIDVNIWDPAESTVDYWTVFDKSTVRRVDLTVSQTNWNLMWADVNAEVEVEADATVFGTYLPSIGLRMKGNSSLTNPSDKKPWKIDTNEFDDEQEYENLKMLIFNNGFKDPSLAREALAYEMMYAAGVPAGNTCFVEIYIEVGTEPAEFWGVYTMVERVDEKYLFNRYGNKGGNLYKGVHGANFEYLGNNIGSYPLYDGEPCYAKKTNEDLNDYSDLLHMLDVLNNTVDNDFTDAFEQVFNVDGYLRYLSATLLHSNLDIHMYMNQNFYLYNNEDTGRFEFIPWDLNEAWGTFGDTYANESHPLYDLAVGVQGPGIAQNVLFERIMAVPEYRTTLAAYYDLLLREHFIADDIGAGALAIHDLVESYVKTGDKMYSGPGSMYDYDDFDSNWNTDIGSSGPGFSAFGLIPFTQTRRDYALAHLLADM